MTTPASKPAVGFIGLGIMGRSMAGHILAGGHPLHVYNRTAAKADALVAAGAIRHAEPSAVAAAADIVFTMLGTPADVEDIVLAPGGLLARARPGAILVDCTTSSPSLARRIAAAAAERGLAALDAPVSGGDVGARDAKLSIMVGGDQDAFERVRPVLALMGTNIRRQGGPGAGQHTKMANQIVIASTLMGVCEGLAYAGRTGLDPAEVLNSIGTGAAGGFQLTVLGPRMLAGDFAPGFTVHHLLKDLGIALDEAKAMGLDLPGLELARRLYQRLAAEGGGADGTQALFRLYQPG